MSESTCQLCGEALPRQHGPGRRHRFCESCRPKRVRARRADRRVATKTACKVFLAHCSRCSILFVARRSNVRYCTRKCRLAMKVRREMDVVGSLECAQCGSMFDVTKVGARNGQRYCSVPCSLTARRQWAKECVQCGQSFEVDKHGIRPSDVCSDECRVEREKSRYRARSARVVGVRACETCGEEFAVRATQRNQKFCSRPCSHAHLRRDHGQGTCAYCGEVFERDKPARKFCSTECQWASYKRNFPKSVVYFPECGACGVRFCSRVKKSKYCSDTCRYRVQVEDARQRGNALYALATQFIDGKYVGAEWRKALLHHLVDRDGDRCGICNRKVDITLKSGTRGSRRGPSVDHIIPRSLGGSDDLSNLRLAHWGCNQKRGNRAEDEQLALVG